MGGLASEQRAWGDVMSGAFEESRRVESVLQCIDPGKNVLSVIGPMDDHQSETFCINIGGDVQEKTHHVNLICSQMHSSVGW